MADAMAAAMVDAMADAMADAMVAGLMGMLNKRSGWVSGRVITDLVTRPEKPDPTRTRPETRRV